MSRTKRILLRILVVAVLAAPVLAPVTEPTQVAVNAPPIPATVIAQQQPGSEGVTIAVAPAAEGDRPERAVQDQRGESHHHRRLEEICRMGHTIAYVLLALTLLWVLTSKREDHSNSGRTHITFEFVAYLVLAVVAIVEIRFL